MPVAFTIDQLKPLLADKLRDALNRRLDPSNRVGSMMRLADAIGASQGAVEGWAYAETLPSFAAWGALVHHYGPEFHDEVMTDITGVKATTEAHEELAALKKQIAELHQRAGNGGFVKVEGGAVERPTRP